VRILRQALRWREIEYAQGKYTFVYFDGYVRALAEHGIRLMPILFDPPDWRSSRPASGAKRGVYPPRRNKAMASFAARVVRRYGSKGSFWRENGDLPKVPVRDWQVWNEPNFPHYWPPKPNAKKYVALQRTVAKAIRKADRKANVVTAGLPNSAAPGAVPLTKYIKAMYKARARGTFDTLAVNAYATSAKAMIKQVKSVRKIMKRRRDRSRIWVTEIGWATQGPKSRFTVTPRRQAELIRQTFDKAAKQRRRLGIRGVVYFNWQDSEPYEGFHDFWGLHTGLLDSEGVPKPGLGAFASRAKRYRNIR
jgi:hypothetical protein